MPASDRAPFKNKGAYATLDPNASQWVLRLHRRGAVKRSSEIILVADGVLCNVGGRPWTFLCLHGNEKIPSLMTPYTDPTTGVVQPDADQPASGMDLGDASLSTAPAVWPQPFAQTDADWQSLGTGNDDNSAYGSGRISWRHYQNRGANFLFIDGHVEGRIYNKLLKKNLYHDPNS